VADAGSWRVVAAGGLRRGRSGSTPAHAGAGRCAAALGCRTSSIVYQQLARSGIARAGCPALAACGIKRPRNIAVTGTPVESLVLAR
jgi:hypothetical protein